MNSRPTDCLAIQMGRRALTKDLGGLSEALCRNLVILNKIASSLRCGGARAHLSALAARSDAARKNLVRARRYFPVCDQQLDASRMSLLRSCAIKSQYDDLGCHGFGGPGDHGKSGRDGNFLHTIHGMMPPQRILMLPNGPPSMNQAWRRTYSQSLDESFRGTPGKQRSYKRRLLGSTTSAAKQEEFE